MLLDSGRQFVNLEQFCRVERVRPLQGCNGVDVSRSLLGVPLVLGVGFDGFEHLAHLVTESAVSVQLGREVPLAAHLEITADDLSVAFTPLVPALPESRREECLFGFVLVVAVADKVKLATDLELAAGVVDGVVHPRFAHTRGQVEVFVPLRAWKYDRT